MWVKRSLRLFCVFMIISILGQCSCGLQRFVLLSTKELGSGGQAGLDQPQKDK